MPHRSRINVEYVKHLRRQSTEQLYLSLSRQLVHSARQNVIVHRKARSGKFYHLWTDSDREVSIAHKRSEPYSEAATIDLSMLQSLRSALRNEVSADNGEELFETLWRRMKRRVCDDFDLCNKWQGGDAGLIIALLMFLRRGQPVVGDDAALVFVIVLAVRMGPEWMCGCSRR
jgi:hypothetical protein